MAYAGHAGRLLAASLLAGCNMVLGIDDARLDEDAGAAMPDASLDAGVDPGGDDAGGGTCEKTGEACWDCTASKCCTEFSACQSDPSCAQTLASYNDCIEAPPDGGESCAERLAGQNAKFLALTNCTLLEKCFAACADWPLGNLCKPYCACMAENCAEKTFGDATCAEVCPTLSAEQIQCRSLHCTFAKGDPVHCDHAAGEAVCP